MKAKKKKDEADITFTMFCSKCQKKHPLQECPINYVEIGVIYDQNHPTGTCPSFLELKAMYQGGGGVMKELNKFCSYPINDHGHLNR